MSFDLFPTMLDMANIHYDDSKKKLDGASLVPLFKGKELSQRLLFWGNGNKTISVRDGKWKLVRYNQKGKITLHLFDLDNDPYEENNMSEQEPELVKRLDEQITRWAIQKFLTSLLEKYDVRIKITLNMHSNYEDRKNSLAGIGNYYDFRCSFGFEYG